MVKKRPVIVVSPKRKSASNLLTVVPLSTTEPSPLAPWHVEIPASNMPENKFFEAKVSWAKCDMIYRMGFERLDPICIGKTPEGKRIYFNQLIDAEIFDLVLAGVAASLNLKLCSTSCDNRK